ncbi:MAG: alpha/beta fold hydrolase [Deltaproteobacteria bacterium]|nr:alpha/beta fold hydrolase [Deltaproteobacteria bacterium]
MSAIYSMTTVNHDHIFAGLLRYSPACELREDDLRKRAFLASLFDFEKKGIKRHESLATNQISLLTDDRYSKYANFIGLAVEKNVVRKKNGALLKESDFSDTSDFHHVRMDNPLAVIANEIEPLTEFDGHLRVIARMPTLRLRYHIRKYLLGKAILDFEKDYAGSVGTGLNRSNKVGMPFLLKGKNRNLGILLLHGYMAAPLEVRALAEYLNGHGWWVYVSRLSGHGTSPEDLAARTYMDWVESAEEGYAIIANSCRKAVVGGFSTGAGLALDLCTRVSSVAGAFAISPPMKLQDFSARFVPAISLWNRLMNTMNVESAKKEFIENHPENPQINYLRNPVSGILELGRLMDQLEPKISAIDVAVLVIQSLSDPVVHHGGAFKIFQKIGSRNKEFLMVNYPRHGIVNGPGSGRIFSAVAEFIKLNAAAVCVVPLSENNTP